MEPAAISFANTYRYRPICNSMHTLCNIFVVKNPNWVGIRHIAFPFKSVLFSRFILFLLVSISLHFIAISFSFHPSSNSIPILIEMNFQRNGKSFRTFSIWSWKFFFCILCISLACSFHLVLHRFHCELTLFICRKNIFFFSFHVRQLRKPSLT